jgi:rhamnosyltransferase
MKEPVLDRVSSTVAVVVTYRPDAERLTECLRAILPQVDEVVVVDNGSDATALDGVTAVPRVSVIRLLSNFGIACAQNRGIERAIELRATYILLLDQDSVAAPDMADRLRVACEVLVASGHRVGAVGPAQIDGLSAASPRFTQFRWGRYMQVEAPIGAHSVSCDMLIASGALIPAAALGAIGPMEEGLFIDKVDTEWCLRARRCGFGLFGVPGAKLHHRLGESVLTVRWWRMKRLPVHKPFRYYYMIRNSVLLQRARHMRWAWRAADFTQTVQIMLFHGLLAPGARLNRAMIYRGLQDGLRSVTGPMPGR